MTGRPVKHSVTLKGHRTSISLETEFWVALKKIAGQKGQAINALVTEIDINRSPDTGLASAIRVYVLLNLQRAIADFSD